MSPFARALFLDIDRHHLLPSPCRGFSPDACFQPLFLGGREALPWIGYAVLNPRK
jgi:hypothetical protein